MNKFFQILGLVIVSLGGFGFFFEAAPTTPIVYQLLLWLACLVVMMLGYCLYRSAGGTFSISRQFTTYESWSNRE